MMNLLWGKGDEPDDSKAADNVSNAPMNSIPTTFQHSELAKSPHQTSALRALLDSPLSLADSDPNPNANDQRKDPDNLEWRTVIFIRHGNSM